MPKILHQLGIHHCQYYKGVRGYAHVSFHLLLNRWCKFPPSTVGLVLALVLLRLRVRLAIATISYHTGLHCMICTTLYEVYLTLPCNIVNLTITITTVYRAIRYHIVLYHTILHYTTLHYTTLLYSTLLYTTLHYTTLHYTTLHYTLLIRLYKSILYYALLCCTRFYSVLL